MAEKRQWKFILCKNRFGMHFRQIHTLAFQIKIKNAWRLIKASQPDWSRAHNILIILHLWWPLC
jgi:hypothetical protein